MVDSFLKLPLWIQIILMIILVSVVAFFIYKGVAAEKIKIGKEGIELDDLDKVPTTTASAPEVKKDEVKS